MVGSRFQLLTRIAIAVAAISLAPPLRCRGDDAASTEFFESRIRPVLVRHCYECHSQAVAKAKGGLRLDSREAIRQGGESGPAVEPGDVANSLLITAIRHESFEMPPKKKLPESVIADFVKWIEAGAPDPRDAAADPNAVASELWDTQFQDRLNWWSLRPVVRSEVPTVQDTMWSSQAIDRFILAKLEEHQLRPASIADKRTLIRRLSFTLTGLPPTPRQLTQFLDDESASTYEALVDRLLDSPHFGERWARHWMDVVRYTDTYGYEWDIPAKGAWRYRDYLIRAFNQDVPFDQLIREQLAGDLLESPRVNEAEQINESLIGTMFYQLGEKRHGDSSEFNGIHQEMIDNKIDAFSKAFQAMTIACARCHDHKLDAVSQREYYALAGSFMSSRWVTNTIDLPTRNADVIQSLKVIKTKLRTALGTNWAEHLAEANRESLADSLTMLARDSQSVPLEHPLHAWSRITSAAAQDSDIASAWSELSSIYANESEQRSSENKTHFKLIVDFRHGPPVGWSVDGVGLQEIVRSGDFVVALDGDSAIASILPSGLFTNSLSPRLNGAVRTPYLNTLTPGHISFECCGGDFAAQRTVYDNAFLTEKQVYLKQATPKWKLLSTVPAMRDRRIFIEFATKTSNPNFPPRVGLGGATTKEQEADPRSWFGITRVVTHDAPLTPKDELTRFAPLFTGDAPKTLEHAADRYAAWFAHAIETWRNDVASPEDVEMLNWLLDNRVLDNTIGQNEGSQIFRLVADYREAEKLLATPCTVNGLADIDEGYDYHLNIRGDYDQLGEAVPRGFVEAVTGSKQAFAASTSGRRELAEFVASPHNPLTARVFVNRVWHWIFGTGIVSTPSDFGHLGDQPSHPELLDYLASQFVADEWSMKKLIRAIVLTETFRQSGFVDQLARDIDPKNRLLHHYPLKRLEGEAIRDAMLAVSGRLDPTLFGPPIDPLRANEDAQKRLFSGPLDGDGRRSIYTKITIMEPPRLLALFNQPEPKIPTGQRDVTNTPAQSLALLNDPFVERQAEHWAEQLIEIGHRTPEDRISNMFERALGRSATDLELTRWAVMVDDLAALHKVPSETVMGNVSVWKDIAHAVFNLKEFIYTR
ncbi:MAG TPA: PSD1 and planctomycete cytochrome C domain-containing protein [Pirellulaceae bacterium]|nr:PSD1 and planctomycete cytochrome C domain-containing protein [Pirellulaceae bacterium]